MFDVKVLNALTICVFPLSSLNLINTIILYTGTSNDIYGI